MILDHVAQRSGTCRNTRTALHTQWFAGGDLNMIDVASVPELLENGIGKPHYHDVLRGLFPEIMIDPEGIVFGESVSNHLVEPLSAGQVGSKGLFDDDPCPTAWSRPVETALAQVFQNHRELIWSS